MSINTEILATLNIQRPNIQKLRTLHISLTIAFSLSPRFPSSSSVWGLSSSSCTSNTYKKSNNSYQL